MERAHTYIALSVILLIFLVIAAVVWTVVAVTDKKKKTTSKPKASLKARQGPPQGTDFYIYNYLLKPVRIDIITEGTPTPFIDYITPTSKKGLKMSTVVKYFRSGSYFRIYVKLDSKDIHYSDYSLDLPKDSTIRALHIGMITSRWVGATQDSTFKPGVNAVQGRPWIKIHNNTAMDLHINNNIRITPRGTLRYTGRDHFGVRIGTIFTDQYGIFPPWKFDIPATDVYWGVVSDLQQSLWGGWQIDSEFNDSSDEPMYLLENGWMGGPAYPTIAPGFIPKDGPATAPLDRWGELPDNPKIIRV